MVINSSVRARRAYSRPAYPTVYSYAGRRGIPRIAHQRLALVSPPPRTSYRSQDLYSDLEDRDEWSTALRPYSSYHHLPQTKVVYISDVTYAPEDYYSPRYADHDSALFQQTLGLRSPLYSGSIPLRNSNELRDIVDIRRHYIHQRNNPGVIYRPQRERSVPYIGKSNLACLSFAAGRPISKRRRFYPEDERISQDIRAYFNSFRAAANLERLYNKKPLYQPLYKSQKTIMGGTKDDTAKPKFTESKWVTRAFSQEPSMRTPTVREEEEPKPEPRASLLPEIRESVTLPSPRKSIVELPKEVEVPYEAPEEKVVVKIPRKPSIQEEPVVVETAAETVKVASPEKVEKVKKAKKPVPAPEPEPEPEPVVVPEPEPEPVVVPEPEPEVIPEPEPEPPKPQPEPEPVVVPEPEPEPVVVPEPEPEVMPEPEPEPEVVPEPAPVPDVVPEPEPEPEVIPEPEPQPEVVPEPEPEPEAVPDPEPEPKVEELTNGHITEDAPVEEPAAEIIDTESPVKSVDEDNVADSKFKNDNENEDVAEETVNGKAAEDSEDQGDTDDVNGVINERDDLINEREIIDEYDDLIDEREIIDEREDLIYEHEIIDEREVSPEPEERERDVRVEASEEDYEEESD